MRTVLTSKISGSTEVQLAAVTQDEITTVEKMVTEEADVAAIYIHLGGSLAGLDIARNVSKACPESGILIIVDQLAGVDVKRYARMFGVAWSYALTENVEAGTGFVDVVQSVARGIHWIDPGFKRVLEAIWKVVEQGRDMEIDSAVKQMNMSASPSPDSKPEAPAESDPSPDPKPRGIQTMSTGKGGIGSGGFGVSKAG